uniref:Uncharacterized protein n=2 Tax=Rhodosorus marinus TaxID=101924 RepID=A0A7S2ZW79_9RHOD|mmetsp:Transcript_31590/g.122333  ORF Transcript_31590/g.122333 Transcript_31590/m.122333 type:complete len:138 (+) Transcript_31590:199-612(+)
MDSKLSRVKLTTVVVGDNSRFCRSKIQEVTVTETVFMGDACFDRASLHKVTFAKVTFVGKVNFGGATLTAVRFVDVGYSRKRVQWVLPNFFTSFYDRRCHGSVFSRTPSPGTLSRAAKMLGLRTFSSKGASHTRGRA